jgi:hypothetical protein
MKPQGGNWSDLELVSSESTNDSSFTSIAVDVDGFVHVSWWDREDLEEDFTFITTWVVYYNYKPVEDTYPLLIDDIPDGGDSTDATPGFEFLLGLCAILIMYFVFSRKYS